MSLILDGTNGLSDVDGSAATPAIRGSDANTGVFFGTDIVGVSTGGTERVRVDASGNVGIGTSSPGSPLEIFRSGGGDWLRLARGTTGTGKGAVSFGLNNAGVYSEAARISGTSDSGNVNNGLLTFQTTDSLGVNTERMRIDSSGNLLVGATGTVNNERLRVDANITSFGTRLLNSNASPQGVTVGFTGAAPNGTGNPFITCGDTATDRFIARSNGGLANYSGNDVNLSDRREKTNFVPAKSYLETICAIPVQTFNYIDQNHEEDPGLTLGVVAQDVQEVAPELVMESNWAKEGEEPKMRLSIYQTDLQYALMKCIQEQQAIITALTARVEALEGAQA
jgi:hypothetical protein